jgi:hypothetical protein
MTIAKNSATGAVNMPVHTISRRGLVFSTLALAACQTTGVDMTDRALTNSYDGEYTLAIGRTHNPTPENALDRLSYADKYDSLAFIRLRVEGGRFIVMRVDQSDVAKGYSDFQGYFFEGGSLEIRATAGYMYGGSDRFYLHIAGMVGDELLGGAEVVLKPRGFNSNYAAHVAIKRVG